MSNEMENVKSNNVWSQDGQRYFPGSTAKQTKLMPPGIYRYEESQMEGWWLRKTFDKYTFPYKIYGTQDDIVNRVKRAWDGLSSNFGVLLNGLKGTGKTIAAQQIANWAVDKGMIVLAVSQPIALSSIMEKVEQPMLILLDEFEKTHDDKLHPGAQQSMLSAVDGLSRSQFRRLFLFTSNTKKIDDNFIDRPSRIRYTWEFGRVGMDVINMMLDDLLDPKLAAFRPAALEYFNTREVLTIDVVKTVIIEMNIFREEPVQFKSFMNLSEKTPGAFKVEIVQDNGQLLEISSYFKSNQGAWLSAIMSKTGQQMFIDNFVAQNKKQHIVSSMNQYINILGPTDKVDEWICEVQIPTWKTWIGTKLAKEVNDYLWLDRQPDNFRPPEWAKKIEKDIKLTEQEDEEKDGFVEQGSVYGSDKHAKVRVKFTVDHNSYQYSHKSFFGHGGPEL